MQYTTNYNIPKFDGTDAVNPNSRNGLNSGADIVDTQLKANADNITSANANITALDTRVDTLEDRQVYSETEQVVGTWVDGKPLYRKVIVFTPDNHTYLYTHNIPIATLSRFFATYNGASLPILIENSESNCIYCHCSSARIRFWSGSGQTLSGNCTCVIEYTKTTD